MATADGEPAGFGAAEHDDNHIGDIWVAPEHEGKGAGSALVRALESDFQRKGFDAATIHFSADNVRALGLYLRLGYVEQRRQMEHDPILDVTLEKVALAKPLSRLTL